MRDRFVSRLFVIIILFTLIMVLMPLWSGSLIWNYFSSFESFSHFQVVCTKFLVGFLLLLVMFFQKKIKIVVSDFFLLLSFVSILLSALVNGLDGFSFTVLTGLLFYYVIFTLYPNYCVSDNLLNLCTYILLLWCILPLVHFFFSSRDTQLLFYTNLEGSISTFSGYAFHRNWYAIYVGMTILLLLFSNFKWSVKCILGLLLLIGLVMSESRSVFVSVVCSILVYCFFKYKLNGRFLFLLLVLSVVSFFLYVYFDEYSLRGYASSGDDGRSEIWNYYWSFIKDHFFWGNGKPLLYVDSYSLLPNYAHNFVLQSVADYGILSLVFFLLYLVCHFVSISNKAKTLFVYLIIISLFQPYYMMGTPTLFAMNVFFLSELSSKSIN